MREGNDRERTEIEKELEENNFILKKRVFRNFVVYGIYRFSKAKD